VPPARRLAQERRHLGPAAAGRVARYRRRTGPTSKGALNMPLIEVKLYEHRVTEESVPKIIEKLTDALHESSGAAKEHIHVIVQGVSPEHWGMNGKPGA